jgi:tetratricopeptide (TPR) repeat protein
MLKTDNQFINMKYITTFIAIIFFINAKAQDSEQNAEKYFTRGVQLAYAFLDYKGAIESLDLALLYNPNLKRVYRVRGYSKGSLRDYTGAISDFNLAIKENPKDSYSYFHRGNAKAELGDYRGAILDYTQAIILEPDYAEAYHNRGLAKHQLNDINGCCLDLSKAGELGNENSYKKIKEYCQ